MYKTTKRNLPNIDLRATSKTRIAKTPLKQTKQYLIDKPSIPSKKFPILKKDSYNVSQNMSIVKQINTTGYFYNINKKYESEASMLKLFYEFKLFNDRALKYYSNYRLHQLQLLTKKHQHIYLPESNKQNPKPLLLLDLDETLIHSDVKQNAQSDIRIEFISTLIGQTNQKSVIYLSLRPHLNQFLQKISASGLFEIGVFTAGSKGYAEAILNYIDPQRKYIQHRIFRDNCIQLPQSVFAKDLRIFKNRNINQILLVDNSPFCFANRRNGIPILSYEGNQKDKQLLQLFNYLSNLASEPQNLLKRNYQYFRSIS